MPIVNSVFKSQKLFASEFFCPNCFVIRPYEITPLSQETNFCILPLLESKAVQDVIVCKVCQKAFDPEILARNIQSLLKIVGVAKCQLDRGISPGAVKMRLVSDGLQEHFANELITLALH